MMPAAFIPRRYPVNEVRAGARELLNGFAAETYHADREAVSQGHLQEIIRSPAHFVASWTGPGGKDTAYKRGGNIVHAGLFEPERFAGFAVMPDFGHPNAKATKEAKSAWLAEHPNAEVVKQDELDEAIPIIEAIRGNAKWQELTTGMLFEQTIYWTHSPTGIWSRARLDGVGLSGLVLDLKVTQNAEAKAFARHIEDFGYHFQAAHYLEAVNETALWEVPIDGGTPPPGKGIRFDDYVFCVVERDPPHGVKFYLLDQRAITRGRALRERAYEILSRCIETNNWPGYDHAIETIDLPQWAYSSSGGF